MPAVIELPDIADAERAPLVEQLVGLIETLAEQTQHQAETIQKLLPFVDRIARYVSNPGDRFSDA